MTLLVLGLILFFIPHLFRELHLRDAIISSLPSEGAYKGIYSLLALVGLGLIIYGKSQAEFIMVREPAFEMRFISHVLMLPAFILLVAGNIPTSYMKQRLRNPMLLGVALWGVSHLWSNGDLASLLLFGGFTLWAGFKFVALGLEKGPVTKSPSLVWDIVAVVGGLILYAVISVNHGPLFGVGLSFV